MSDSDLSKDTLILSNHQLAADLKRARQDIRKMRSELIYGRMWWTGTGAAVSAAITAIVFILKGC